MSLSLKKSKYPVEIHHDSVASTPKIPIRCYSSFNVNFYNENLCNQQIIES